MEYEDNLSKEAGQSPLALESVERGELIDKKTDGIARIIGARACKNNPWGSDPIWVTSPESQYRSYSNEN